MKMCSVIAFAGGMLAGGVIALMLAPKKGAELRDDISGKLNGVKKRIDEVIDGHCGKCCCDENSCSVDNG